MSEDVTPQPMQANPADIIQLIEKMVEDAGINIPSGSKNIIDTLGKGIGAFQSLIPEQSQAEAQEIEQTLVDVLQGILQVEEKLVKLVGYSKK